MTTKIGINIKTIMQHRISIDMKLYAAPNSQITIKLNIFGPAFFDNCHENPNREL